MGVMEPVTIYEVLRHHGVSKADAAKMARVTTSRMDLSKWVKAPWGGLINTMRGAVEYHLDMSGFPPGTLVYLTSDSDSAAFMFEVWVPSPFGEDVKVLQAGLERNVAAEMPEKGEAMRNKVKEELEVLAWAAHAELTGCA